MPEHTTRTAQRTTAVHSPELVNTAVTLGCHEVTKPGVSLEKVPLKVGDEPGAVLSPTPISEGAQAPEDTRGPSDVPCGTYTPPGPGQSPGQSRQGRLPEIPSESRQPELHAWMRSPLRQEGSGSPREGHGDSSGSTYGPRRATVPEPHLLPGGCFKKPKSNPWNLDTASERGRRPCPLRMTSTNSLAPWP